MKRIILIVAGFMVIIALTGCGKEQPPPKKPAAEKVVQQQPKPEVPAAQQKPPVQHEEIAYDAKGRRDPFVPLVQISKEKPKRRPGASPMESYGIDEIHLLAIAWDKNKYYALIRLPDKKTYTITEGMALGLQGGRVEKITKDSILIREFMKDYKGEIKPRDTILKLHKGEE
ncbi:MAG: pilus assembly protein PilP [Nitrospirota bacterium]